MSIWRRTAISTGITFFLAGTVGLNEVSRAHRTADAMEALATRLAQEITRSVLHFKRQSDMENPARVYVTGGAARLAGLDAQRHRRQRTGAVGVDVFSRLDVDRRTGCGAQGSTFRSLTNCVV